jgi:hypothetical protein
MNIKLGEEILKTVLDEQRLVSLDWMILKGYIGIVGAYHLIEQEIEKILSYCHLNSIGELYYLPSDSKFNWIKPCIIPATLDSLKEIEHRSAGIEQRAIFPQNLDFFVLTDGDYYHILVGSVAFIEFVFGSNDIVKDYVEQLNGLTFGTKDAKEFLYSLAERYPGIIQ